MPKRDDPDERRFFPDGPESIPPDISRRRAFEAYAAKEGLSTELPGLHVHIGDTGGQVYLLLERTGTLTLAKWKQAFPHVQTWEQSLARFQGIQEGDPQLLALARRVEDARQETYRELAEDLNWQLEQAVFAYRADLDLEAQYGTPQESFWSPGLTAFRQILAAMRLSEETQKWLTFGLDNIKRGLLAFPGKACCRKWENRTVPLTKEIVYDRLRPFIKKRPRDQEL